MITTSDIHLGVRVLCTDPADPHYGEYGYLASHLSLTATFKVQYDSGRTEVYLILAGYKFGLWTLLDYEVKTALEVICILHGSINLHRVGYVSSVHRLFPGQTVHSFSVSYPVLGTAFQAETLIYNNLQGFTFYKDFSAGTNIAPPTPVVAPEAPLKAVVKSYTSDCPCGIKATDCTYHK